MAKQRYRLVLKDGSIKITWAESVAEAQEKARAKGLDLAYIKSDSIDRHMRRRGF